MGRIYRQFYVCRYVKTCVFFSDGVKDKWYNVVIEHLEGQAFQIVMVSPNLCVLNQSSGFEPVQLAYRFLSTCFNMHS